MDPIIRITSILVGIIAFSAFLLSFKNLTEAAIEAGIDPIIAPLWPVCIDALLVAGSLMIYSSIIKRESPLTGWIIMIAFVATSVAFNVAHSPSGLLAQAAHAVPPIALCVSIEMLMQLIRTTPPSHHAQKPAIETIEEKIKKYKEMHPEATFTEISKAIGISRQATTKRIKKMVELGIIPG